MSRFFGRRDNKASSSNEPDVLSQITESKDLIEKRQAHLSRKAAEATTEAITHKSAGRKDLALSCLKRKKLLDEELAGLVQQLTKLDAQENALQSLKFSELTLAAERRATEEIKRKLGGMGGIDAIEDQREATEETLIDAYELLGVMAQPTAIPGLTQDDDELLAELAEMEEEEERKHLELSLNDLSCLDTVAAFPSAPSRLEKEARELAEIDALAASMSMEAPMSMSMHAMPMHVMTLQVA